jgi:hypothetical protein
VAVVDAGLVRGEDTGLSEARYVVEKMLSRSSSCGRSSDDCQSVFSGAIGAVLERPVCESFLGVTVGSSCGERCAAPWLGLCGAFDLTDAGGEVFVWASECGDMGPTLVRLAVRHSTVGVGDRVADIAGRALRRASAAVVGVRQGHNAAGLACEGERARPGERWQTRAIVVGGRWLLVAVLRIRRCCKLGQRVRIAADPRSNLVWTAVTLPPVAHR